jgi:hypothetical protein
MGTKLSLQRTTTRRTLPLRTWQRLAVGTALVVATTICAALIYFQPGTRTFTVWGTMRPVAVTAPVPAQPPDTDLYYYWDNIDR